MEMARHTYDNWVRDHDTGAVGVIIQDLPKRYVMVQWFNGPTTVGPFMYDLITEYEYCRVVNPKRCGLDIPELIAAMREGAQEDYFTGGLWRNSMVKKQQEDFFK